MILSLAEIDDLYLWLDNNKVKIRAHKTFKDLAKTVCQELFKESTPSPQFIGEIALYIKEYSPETKPKKCSVCNGSKGILSFMGVKPGKKYNFIPCQFCNGSGNSLTPREIVL